jgi:hypothetical protein
VGCDVRQDRPVSQWRLGGYLVSVVECGYCAHCGGRFIRTVNDEPNRVWCGACPEGQPKTAKKTYGFARKALVPDGTGTPKVCSRCDKWFAAIPRQRTCDGCLSPGKKTLKAASRVIARDPLVSGQVRAGQRVVKHGFVEVFSDYMNLTFRCPVKDPRAASLECRVLAYEDAARRRWNGSKTPVMPESVTG